jgi:trk system potassium uptake protein TrkA
MRIILIGGGEVGYALASALARDHSIFVVDHDPVAVERFRALDVEVLLGGATSTSVLESARVAKADLLIAATGQDEVNMVACAIGTRLGVERTICLVSKDDFLQLDGTSDSMREHFGIGRVVWPEAQLAEDIERIIAAPGSIDAEVFAGGRIRLLEFRLPSGSPLTLGPISSLHVPHGALLIAAKRRDTIEIPRGDTRLSPGDKIIVMGTPDAMDQVQTLVQAPAGPAGPRLVTIIGGGDVGFRLAQRLESTAGLEVRLIEQDRRRGEMLAATLSRTLVLNGDGTDLELLESEEIGRSDVLVSVIDNDERNLFASLLGRQLGARSIITRVGRPANLRLFERVGIDVALSARGSAVASIVHHVQGGRANLLAVLEEGQATILEVTVPAGFRPTSLRTLGTPTQSIVGAILRGDTAIVPRGDDEIRPLDHLLVFATAGSVREVRDYFADLT